MLFINLTTSYIKITCINYVKTVQLQHLKICTKQCSKIYTYYQNCLKVKTKLVSSSEHL